MRLQNPRALIFLDLDGPLTNHRVSCFPPEQGIMERFDPVAVKALSYLCEQFNTAVVFASTRSIDNSDKNKKHLFYLMSDAGFNIDYIHSDWSATYRGGEKASQIKDYLKRYPEIKKWIMIEDDREDVESLLLVNGLDGMSLSDFLSLENFLKSDARHYDEKTMRVKL